MVFVLDGYNFMHVAGYLSAARRDPLKPARGRFQEWLLRAMVHHPGSITIVYDGQESQRPASRTRHDRLDIQFSGAETADDLIEKLLRKLPSAALTVVSNDQRLHLAARAAGGRAWCCEEFMDWLLSPPAKPVVLPKVEEKHPILTPEDEQELLRAFGRPPCRR